MLRLLRFLIWGDAHLCKWVPYGDVTKVYGTEASTSGTPLRREQSFQCERCGTIRLFEV